MTAEEVAEEYSAVIVRGLERLTQEQQVPAEIVLHLLLTFQAELGPLVEKEATARPAIRLATKLAGYARDANQTVLQDRKQMQERVQKLLEPRSEQ